MFCFIYPSLPFSVKTIDPMYKDEQTQAESMGFNTACMDLEELFDNSFKTSKLIEAGTTLIYRGWMLKDYQYENFVNLAKNKGLHVITNTEQYVASHYISGWYPHISNLTFPSVFQENYDFIDTLLENTNFTSYFIKDYVKSLTTSRGSIAHNSQEVKDIVNELIEKRGEIEKGLCVREFHELSKTLEERYFVFQGKAYSRNDIIPPIVLEAVNLHCFPFFSIDVAQKASGEDIIVEIGDAQVSDIKLWTVQKFYEIFN